MRVLMARNKTEKKRNNLLWNIPSGTFNIQAFFLLLIHGCPTFRFIWATLSDEELYWAACRLHWSNSSNSFPKKLQRTQRTQLHYTIELILSYRHYFFTIFEVVPTQKSQRKLQLLLSFWIEKFMRMLICIQNFDTKLFIIIVSFLDHREDEKRCVHTKLSYIWQSWLKIQILDMIISSNLISSSEQTRNILWKLKITSSLISWLFFFSPFLLV